MVERAQRADHISVALGDRIQATLLVKNRVGEPPLSGVVRP
jgi:hypothetical protein